MSINLSALQKQRRDTAANWTAENPTLLAGEIGLESDTGYWKVGDGATAWTSLAYVTGLGAEIPVSRLADGTARQLLQTAANGNDVEWTSNVDVPGTLDVTGAATFDAAVTIQGDLTVNGTTTTIDTQNLIVEDKNVIIGNVTSPTDVTADGGGITLKGTTDKTINWVDATDAWTLSEHVNIASGKEYRIDGTKVLDATSLGSGVVGSSLTSVGTIGTGVWQGTAINKTYLDNTLVSTGDTGTVTSTMIADGTIVDGDVNASAAIAGTKISPDFGSQNVTTTGTNTAASFIPTSSTVPTNGVYLPAANSVALSTNGTGRLFVDANGNVGVGNNPGFAVGSGLEIERDSATATLRLQRTNTGASALELRADNLFTVIDSRLSGQDLLFQTNATERFRCDSSGRLLVGTSSSRQGNGGLQVESTGGNSFAYFTRNVNSSGGVEISLQKSRGTANGSFTVVAAEDEIGRINFNGADGTTDICAARITAAVDGTPGANDMPGRLVFSTTADGASSPTEAARINSNQQLLVGVTAPASGYVDVGTVGAKGFMSRAGKTGAFTANCFNIQWNGSASRLWIDTVDQGSITVSSDYRIKKNIKTIDANCIDRIKQLRPVEYEIADYGTLFKADGIVREGFIAHEVQEVIPSGAEGQKDEENRIQNLRTDAIVAVLTKALQEAISKVETLEAKVAALESA